MIMLIRIPRSLPTCSESPHHTVQRTRSPGCSEQEFGSSSGMRDLLPSGPAADPGDLPVSIAGEELILLPERAAYWPAARTLLVADAHWGKAASFRAEGVQVPAGTTAEGLARIDAALDRTGARRIVFLGDLLHAKRGRSATTFRTVGAWRERHADIAMLLVRGNHDRNAGDPPSDLEIDCADAPVVEGAFALCHQPCDVPGAYVLSGHVHPGVTLLGRGRQRLRLPCFWFRPRHAVLPAFGGFTGLAEVAAAPGDRVCVIAGGTVVEVG